jgi:hypothetical protein
MSSRPDFAKASSGKPLPVVGGLGEVLRAAEGDLLTF